MYLRKQSVLGVAPYAQLSPLHCIVHQREVVRLPCYSHPLGPQVVSHHRQPNQAASAIA